MISCSFLLNDNSLLVGTLSFQRKKQIIRATWTKMLPLDLNISLNLDVVPNSDLGAKFSHWNIYVQVSFC